MGMGVAMIPGWVLRAMERFQQSKEPGSVTVHFDGVQFRQIEKKVVEKAPKDETN